MPDPLIELLKTRFSYDPPTGAITWRVSPHPRIPAGSPAGTYNKRLGVRFVGVAGTKYLAHRLAWALHTGDWPKAAILFGDGDPSNLRFANLALESEHYSQTPSARAARAYHKRKKLKADDALRDANAVAASSFPGVKWSFAYLKWQVTDPTDDHILYGKFDTQGEAETFASQRLDGQNFIDANPPDIRSGDRRVVTSSRPGALTAAEAKETLAYNPKSGWLHWRAVGARADHPHPTPSKRDTLAVQIEGRYYPAHMLAVLLTKSYWPKRRSVTWKNGKRGDNRWTNLAISDNANPGQGER